jgi:uncharacterized protein (DUF58 family)
MEVAMSGTQGRQIAARREHAARGERSEEALTARAPGVIDLEGRTRAARKRAYGLYSTAVHGCDFIRGSSHGRSWVPLRGGRDPRSELLEEASPLRSTRDGGFNQVGGGTTSASAITRVISPDAAAVPCALSIRDHVGRRTVVS